MIDFDEFDADEFAEVMRGQQKYFDMFFEWKEDPLVKECVKQFVRGVAVTVAFGVIRHGVYQYRRYKAGLTEPTN